MKNKKKIFMVLKLSSQENPQRTKKKVPKINTKPKMVPRM